jgi:hypothetical protein
VSDGSSGGGQADMLTPLRQMRDDRSAPNGAHACWARLRLSTILMARRAASIAPSARRRRGSDIRRRSRTDRPARRKTWAPLSLSVGALDPPGGGYIAEAGGRRAGAKVTAADPLVTHVEMMQTPTKTLMAGKRHGYRVNNCKQPC